MTAPVGELETMGRCEIYPNHGWNSNQHLLQQLEAKKMTSYKYAPQSRNPTRLFIVIHSPPSPLQDQMQFTIQDLFLLEAMLPSNTTDVVPVSGFYGNRARKLTQCHFSSQGRRKMFCYPFIHIRKHKYLGALITKQGVLQINAKKCKKKSK